MILQNFAMSLKKESFMVKLILSTVANDTFLKLKRSNKKIEKSIFKSVCEKIELIKQDPKIGETIKKKLIPKEYKNNYGITVLYKIRLANFWRLLYTIKDNELEIIAIIVDIIDHEEYNDIFGFKKK